jgi:hypothetical protein
MLASRSKTVESPNVLSFVVAEDVEVAVVGTHAKVSGLRGIPLAVEFLHLETPSAQDEPQRPFIGPVPRITFDAHLAHRRLRGVEGSPSYSYYKLSVPSLARADRRFRKAN